MKVGDRVMKDKVMNVENAAGTVESINEHYVVVVWDKVSGHWHYTPEQAKHLEIMNAED